MGILNTKIFVQNVSRKRRNHLNLKKLKLFKNKKILKKKKVLKLTQASKKKKLIYQSANHVKKKLEFLVFNANVMECFAKLTECLKNMNAIMISNHNTKRNYKITTLQSKHHKLKDCDNTLLFTFKI